MSEERTRRIREIQREKFGRRYEGANFSSLRLNLDHAKLLQEWCKNPKNFLFITGSPGCGKTYISSAMVDWMYGKVPSFRIWNDQHLLERLRKFIEEKHGDWGIEAEYMTDDEFVILDDMGSSRLTVWQIDVWFKIINTRYESGLPTLITTNLISKQIYEEMSPRIHSRIFAKENTIIDMHSYDDLRQKDLNENNKL